MTRAPPEPRPSFFQARLSSDGYLGVHLTVGIVTLLIAMFVFALIAEGVFRAHGLVALDWQVSNWFYVHSSPACTVFFLLITHLHSTFGVLALTVFFTFFAAKKGAWDWVLCVSLSTPLGLLLNELLKNIFQRARPSFEHPILTLNTYSFPSGHTAAATVLYGMAAAYVVSTCNGWRQVLGVCLAAVMVVLVGLSRIYLGVHYLSDVAAAIASSTGLLAVALTLVAIWRKRPVV